MQLNQRKFFPAKRRFDGTFKAPNTKTSPSTSNDSIVRHRHSLPIFSARKRFLHHVNQNETVILVGETGSGKTTQIPQFLHEDRLDAAGAVAITQPRRVAAISIAKRVAQEMNVDVGSLVGYKVRFEEAMQQNTKLVFQTDGMLLREAMLDPNLSRYCWIILDEAHERTLNTDILFGVVKAAQTRRKHNNMEPLKIIVMSATLDAEKFSKYFRHAPILYVSGRQHPVNVSHASKHQEDWQHATLSTIFQVHKTAPERHDMLVFLTGQEEIENMARQIRLISKDNTLGPRILIHNLYASQLTAIQQKVFQATPPGCRKIVLSTNIAETSLTIPGIRYVIDSGRVKAKVHQASTGLDMLKTVRISQAQGWQRTGRAGREAEGHCYRILTKTEFNELPSNTVPEILRCNLASVMLQMLAMGVTTLESFDFMERPPQDAIDGAIRQLKLLGAIDNDGGLTEVGKKLAAFPLDPRFTKAILKANELGCTEDVITIVAMLSSDSIIVTPAAKRDEAISSRNKFSSSEGDHITYLKLFRAFKAAGDQKEWCQQHFIHMRHMFFAAEVRKQLMEVCRRENVPVQSSGGQTELVRRAMAEGMFMNVARLTKDGFYVTLDSRQQVKLHPSSVMFQTKPEVIIFTELIATQKSYVRDLSLVDAAWLLEAQPEYFRQHRIVA